MEGLPLHGRCEVRRKWKVTWMLGAVMLFLGQEHSLPGHLCFSPEGPASDLAGGATIESKQKCVVFCIDLINTVLSSLYRQARLYYSHDK